MKVYVKDGVVNFYQYQIQGIDKHGRNVTLYARDDTEKSSILSTLSTTTVTNIVPDATSQAKAGAWNILNGHTQYDVGAILDYINQSPTLVKVSAYSNLQTAINVVAANGTVIVDQDTDITSYAPLTLPSCITLMGDIPERKITNTSATALHITAANTSNVTVKQLTFVGAGSGTGGGIYFQTASTNLTVEDVTISQTANYSISIDNPTNASLTNVIVTASGGNGIVFNAGGSSATLNSCHVKGCSQVGFLLNQISNASLISCIAEQCGIGFDLENTNNVSLSLCNSLDSVNTNSSYPGYGLLLDGSTGGNGNSISTFISNNDASYGIYCSTGSSTISNFTQTVSTATPTASIYVGPNVGFITINSMNVVTPASLTSGKYSSNSANGTSTAKNIIDDGQGNATINGILNIESGVTYTVPSATHSFTWKYNPTTNSMDLVYK